MQYIKTQGLLIDTEKNQASILGDSFSLSSNNIFMLNQNSTVKDSVAIKPFYSNIQNESVGINTKLSTILDSSIDINSKYTLADKNSVSFINSNNSNLSSSVGILGNNEILRNSISLMGKNNFITLSGISMLSNNISSQNNSFSVLSQNVTANNNSTVFNSKKSRIDDNSLSILSDNIIADNNSSSFNSSAGYLDNSSLNINGTGNVLNYNSVGISNSNDNLNNSSLSINGSFNTGNSNSVAILSNNNKLFNNSFVVNSSNSNVSSNSEAFNSIGSTISSNSLGINTTNANTFSNSIDLNGIGNTTSVYSINILSDNNKVSNNSFSVNSDNSNVSANSEAFNATGSILVNNAIAFNTTNSNVSSSSIDFNGIDNITSVSSVNILSENNITRNKSFSINSINSNISANSEAFNVKGSTLVNNALAFNTTNSNVSSSSIDFNGTNNITSVSSVNILSNNNILRNNSFAANSINSNISANSEAFNVKGSTLVNNALAFNTTNSNVSSSIDFNGTNNTTSVSSVNILSNNNIVSNNSFSTNSINSNISANSEAFNATGSILVNNALAFNTTNSNVSSSSIDFNGANNTTSVSSVNILSNNNITRNNSFAANSINSNISANSEAFNTRGGIVNNNSIDFNGTNNTTSVSSVNILSNNNIARDNSFAVNSINSNVSVNSEAFNAKGSTLVNNALAFNTLNSSILTNSVDFNGVSNTTSVSSINILSDNSRVSNNSFAANSINSNVSANSEAFNAKGSTLVNNALAFNTTNSNVSGNSIDLNGTNNTTSVSSVNILSNNNITRNNSFAANTFNSNISTNSEAFNARGSTLVNNALAFNTTNSNVSSNSVDFNGTNNTTSISSVNILSNNNIVRDNSFAANSINSNISANSEAFNSRSSTLVNNALVFNTTNSNVSGNSVDFNGTNNTTSVSSVNILSNNNIVSNNSFAVNSFGNNVSTNSEAFNSRGSTITNNSIDFNGISNITSVSSINMLSDNNRVSNNSFAINSSNNNVSANSEAFNSKGNILVNNALAFNTLNSNISSSSIDFNGSNNTTSVSSVNILSNNNIVRNNSFAANTFNSNISTNSEAFNAIGSTLVNNALAFNTINSNVSTNSIGVNSFNSTIVNRSLDVLGNSNNTSISSISINSANSTIIDRSFSINSINSTVSSRSFTIGSNNSNTSLSSVDLFGSDNTLQNSTIGIGGSNVISTKGNNTFLATKNSELNSTNSLAIGGNSITQSLCANNTSTGTNILTIGGTGNKVGSNSLTIGGSNNLISNNSISIGGSNNNTGIHSNVLMLNVNNTNADRSNLVYLPATYVVGDIIVNGKLSASGGIFEIDKSVFASDSAIRITNTISPSTVMVINQRNTNYNVAEFNFGVSNNPIFYVGSAGVSVNTSALIPSNALTVNGDISANKNLKLINSSVLNIGDANLYRSAADTLKTDDNFVVGTLATSTADNSVIVENTGALRKRTINSRIWDTNATFLSGFGLITNKLVKADGSNRLIPTNITDDGILISSTVAASISSSSSLNPALRVVNTGTADSFIVSDESPESTPFVITNTGNVGVGITIPNTKLHVVGGSGELFRVADGSRAIYAGCDSNEPWIGTSTNNDLRIITNALEKMRITAAGNIGVNTISPSKLLTLRGLASASGSSFSGGTGLLRLEGSTSQFSEPAIEFGELALSPTARIASKNTGNGGGDLIFVTRNNTSLTSSLSERVRITGDGNVGIGTTAPDSQCLLHVKGSTVGDDLSIRIENTHPSGYSSVTFGSDQNTSIWKNGSSVTGYAGASSLNIGHVGPQNVGISTNNITRFIVTSSGNVGIGNINPTATLSLPNIISTRKLTLFDAQNSNNQFYGFGVESNTLVYSVDTFNADHVFFSGINSTSRRELFRIMGDGAVSLSAGNINLGNNYGLYWSANSDAASVRFESTGDLTGESKLILETNDNSDEPIVLRQAGSDRMYVGTGGRIGIGNSSPVAKLDVQSLVINEPALFLKPPSGTSGNRSILGMWSTFTSAFPVDTTIRRTADIVAGFSTNNWGNEYLSFNVGFNGVNNDSALTTSEKVRINASGNVGIGTTLPTTRLHLSGSNTTFRIDSTTGNPAIQLMKNFTGSSSLSGYAIYIESTTNALRINRDNPVGTGVYNYMTFTPDNKTQFTGNTYFNTSKSGGSNHVTINGNQTNSNYGVLAYTTFNGTSDVNISEISGLITSHTTGSESGGLVFNTKNAGTMAERIRITPEGNVGIGTTSPINYANYTAQTIYGTLGGVITIGSSSSKRSEWGDATTETYFKTVDSRHLSLGTGNVARMYILSGGNVGVGTTTPNTRFTVNGDISSNSQVFARGLTITPVTSSDTTADLTLASPNNANDVTWFYNNLTTGSYNPLSQRGDKGIIFSTGLSPTEGNMIIGPWSSQQRGIVIDGINGRVGINKRPTLATFDINGSLGTSGNASVSGGTVFIGRQNSASEGGELQLARSLDNAHSWSIDSLGSTITPNLRIFNNDSTGVGRVRMTIDGLSGTVGIGDFSGASFPLSFGATLGNKIGLYDAGSGSGFGFGIQNGMMQIFSQIVTSRVGIGYGNSSAFTETLTVKGANVGIGNTSPSARLSVGPNIGGTETSTVFTTNAGSLSSTASSRLKLASIGFASGNASSLGIEALRVTAGTDWTTTAIGLKMDVDSSTAVNNSELWLRSNGCIGIGTSSPASKLTVNGAISSNANILLSQGTTSNNGLVFGSDTNLYRSGTNTLKTDNHFIVGTLATSTADNSVIVENTGALRKRTINSRVWDTAATFLSGSGTNNRIPKFSSTGMVNSEIEDNGTTIDFTRTLKVVTNGTTASPSLLFGSSNNNGMYFSATDGLMTSLAGSEKFRINTNYVFSPNKLGIGTTSIGTEMLSVAGSIKYGSMSFPTFEGNIDYGSDVAGTWRKLIVANLVNTTYSTIGFKIEITDPRSNHASSDILNATVETIKFNVACIRTQATTLQSPDACYVSGPISGIIRGVRLSEGNYEIQIANRVLHQEYYVKIYSYAANGGHAINYFGGTTATVVTSELVFNSYGGQKIEYFDKGIFTGTGNNDFGHYLQLKEVAAGNNNGPKILFEKNTPNKRWSIGSAKGATENGFGIYEDSSTTAEGTNRLYFAASVFGDGGKVGIGTTSPVYKLEVQGDSISTVCVRVKDKTRFGITAHTASTLDVMKLGCAGEEQITIVKDRSVRYNTRVKHNVVTVTLTNFLNQALNLGTVVSHNILGGNVISVNNTIGSNINIPQIIETYPEYGVVYILQHTGSGTITYTNVWGYLRISGGASTKVSNPGDVVQAIFSGYGGSGSTPVYTIF